ncbi:hypothetical protein [Neisseria mucosa]|uniref:hypothetical protein n=1 Tax=Neisseria mucosa TaxID=488 RepID=UPI003555DBEE
MGLFGFTIGFRRPLDDMRYGGRLKMGCMCGRVLRIEVLRSTFYSGLNLNQDKATKPQAVQIVRQGEATPYWFKVNPL